MTRHMMAALGLFVILAGCVSSGTTTLSSGELAVRGFETPEDKMIVETVPDWRVTKINLAVPDTLVVSEANSIKPRADIVWRGDPLGDRYKQVYAVMEKGLKTGATKVKGAQAVVLDVELIRFHAQTERVRYSFGGNHEIEFWLTVTDARTGAILSPMRKVDATFEALGGLEAVRADEAGQGQKVRILAQLEKVIRAELTRSQPLLIDRPAGPVATTGG